jgi:hypothetical protein
VKSDLCVYHQVYNTIKIEKRTGNRRQYNLQPAMRAKKFYGFNSNPTFA